MPLPKAHFNAVQFLEYGTWSIVLLDIRYNSKYVDTLHKTYSQTIAHYKKLLKDMFTIWRTLVKIGYVSVTICWKLVLDKHTFLLNGLWFIKEPLYIERAIERFLFERVNVKPKHDFAIMGSSKICLMVYNVHIIEL